MIVLESTVAAPPWKKIPATDMRQNRRLGLRGFNRISFAKANLVEGDTAPPKSKCADRYNGEQAGNLDEEYHTQRLFLGDAQQVERKLSTSNIRSYSAREKTHARTNSPASAPTIDHHGVKMRTIRIQDPLTQ